MQLLFVTHHRRFKAEWRSGSFARELAARGHQVTMLCTADRGRVGFDESHDGNVRVVEAPDLLGGVGTCHRRASTRSIRSGSFTRLRTRGRSSSA